MATLLTTAIADAYAAGFEFREQPYPFATNLTQYHPHPLGDIPAGNYTDDTQMSLAIAELLLKYNEPEKITPLQYAEAFYITHALDPRKGYGKGLQTALESSQNGRELFDKLLKHGNLSTRNGACMRAGPVGLLPKEDTVISIAFNQATVTHNSHHGCTSAEAAALMVHAGYYRKAPRKDLRKYLYDQGITDQLSHKNCWQPFTSPVPCDGLKTVRAALGILERYDNTADMLKAAVNQGGDTDSVAAVTLAAASVFDDVEQNLPKNLYDNLENGPCGRDYLAEVDEQLKAKFPRP